jgi:hypothetical protein
MVGSAPGFPHGLIDPIEVKNSISSYFLRCCINQMVGCFITQNISGTWGVGFTIWYLLACRSMPWWLRTAFRSQARVLTLVITINLFQLYFFTQMLSNCALILISSSNDMCQILRIHQNIS